MKWKPVSTPPPQLRMVIISDGKDMWIGAYSSLLALNGGLGFATWTKRKTTLTYQPNITHWTECPELPPVVWDKP